MTDEQFKDVNLKLTVNENNVLLIGKEVQKQSKDISDIIRNMDVIMKNQEIILRAINDLKKPL